MSQNIFRVVKNKDNPYVTINKTVLEDTRLSMKAKGLHCYMLSMVDDWVFYRSELATHFTDGESAIKAALKELQEFGYIRVYAVRDRGRFVRWHTHVFETPTLAEAHLPNDEETLVSYSPEPEVDFPLVDKPLVEDRALTSNNLLTNTNNNNIRAGARASNNPNAKAFVQQLLLGDERKRKERRLPPAEVTQEPPFRVEPHTPEPYDEKLQQEMLGAGVSSASCRAFFRAYTVDRIRASFDAMMQYQKAKPIRSVGGWLKNHLENPYEIEVKAVPKPPVALLEGQKVIADSLELESRVKAFKSDTEALKKRQALIEEAKRATKSPHRHANSSHG